MTAEKWVRAWIDRPGLALGLTLALTIAGAVVSPFGARPDLSVRVDALPDLGENQQIVFTAWPGRSPKDVDDQLTFPLSSALLGLGGVRTVRATSMFGFSSVYVLFEEGIPVGDARARILEKLASLPEHTLPTGVAPRLGPEANGLGQIYWYTLVPRLESGAPAPSTFALHELRSIQDFIVKPALQSVSGVAEVASVGGFVREYHVEVDAERMRAHGLGLDAIVSAVRGSNLDVGARTLEVNRVEYVVRGVGFVTSVADLEETVVEVVEHVPIRLREVARVRLGPAPRRGALDDAGAPAVGGVVVLRQGENAREVLDRVDARLREIGPGLPSQLGPAGEAQVRVEPFYDRRGLIRETLGTLSSALLQQLLITLLVVIVLLRHLSSALLVAAVLPVAVLGTFLGMRAFDVEANLMSLAGVAIAIGTMVDMGIVLTESMLRSLDEEAGPRSARLARGVVRVAPSVLTAALTTIVAFLPVLALEGAEGRLFRPLALTKTFAVLAAFLVSFLLLPVWARLILRGGGRAPQGLVVVLALGCAAGLGLVWRPLGAGVGWPRQVLSVTALLGAFLLFAWLFERSYPRLAAFAVEHRARFLLIPAGLVAFAVLVVFGLPRSSSGGERFPGLGREFMPAFDEGAFLFMPSTTPHASIGQAETMLASLDAAISAIPEVDRVVGKLGRVESALDPAPVSMFEVIVTYRAEFLRDEEGRWVRQWRDHIRRPEDIWREVERAGALPGVSKAPLLMPIGARLVMLQSGTRSPFGIALRGSNLEDLEGLAPAVEGVLRRVPEVRPETVLADRVAAKPYLEIEIDRAEIARCGLTVSDVQAVIQTGIGGSVVTRTVEGRERYAVRVRYARKHREDLEALRRVLVATRTGDTVPLSQFASFRYVRGPQMIRSEDTFLVSYVLFDKQPGLSDTEVIQAAQTALSEAELELPPGASFRFVGTWENQVRSESRLMLLVPVSLLIVVLLLYGQFGVGATFAVATGVLVSCAGGAAGLWLWGQPELAALFGSSLASAWDLGPVNLSVAVWVGFIALVGIATDDGVLLTSGALAQPTGTPASRALASGAQRLKPCLMTTMTTVMALLPILTSSGRGADLMRPVALPLFGGMMAELLTLLMVPALLSWVLSGGPRRDPGRSPDMV